MTPKEKIVAFINRFDDNITRDKILYNLDLYINVELGMKDIEEGRTIDHDELFDDFSRKSMTMKRVQAKMVGASKPKSSRNQKLHRRGQPRGGSKVYEGIASVRRKPA